MRLLSMFLITAGVALAAPVGIAATQERSDDTGSFQLHENYEEAALGSEELTIKTRSGEKRLRVSFAKLRVTQTTKPAAIKLPGAGIALVQHTAGAAKFATEREKFEPLEGEWLRLALPAAFSIGTDNDSITMDLILVEEQAGK